MTDNQSFEFAPALTGSSRLGHQPGQVGTGKVPDRIMPRRVLGTVAGCYSGARSPYQYAAVTPPSMRKSLPEMN